MLENMLDYLRIALYTAVLVLGLFLYQAWEKEHHSVAPPPTATLAASSIPITPASTITASGKTLPIPESVNMKGDIVHVTTDVLAISIDTRGGDIIEAKLLQYPESLNSKTPYVLFNDNPQIEYIAESGLLGKSGPDTTESQAFYSTEHTTYTLEPNQNEITVPLLWGDRQGVKVTKVFTFKRNSYEINVGYNIQNQSPQPWEGHFYTQLMRKKLPSENHGLTGLTTYFGAAISSPEKPFQKITFSDMEKTTLNQTIQGGWAAMIHHYFVSAWIPPKNSTSNYYSKVTANGLYAIGMMSAPLQVMPGNVLATEATLYVVPTLMDRLKAAAPGLQLTIDYGWFWFIAAPIFWMLQKIYEIVGNWGWAIVIVTILIKLLFYIPSAKSYRSMSVLKKLQPKMEALKERYKDDKQKFTQATLELYRQEKVNPMSGCWPILIQIPVFIALYWVLVESVELRQAPFILWIHDLSQKDPYYVLPILMMISMFLQQRLSPPPPDPMQAKIMMLMPLIFGFLFLNFPAGLMLYWVVNNTLSFLQQWYVMHTIK